MPRPEMEVSGASLWRRITVRSIAAVAPVTTTISPPRPVVLMAAVLSPGSSGVMKRLTSTRAPSWLTDRCRGSGPTAVSARIAPVPGWSLSSRPVDSSVNQAALPAGSKARPKGREPRGIARVWAMVRVDGLTMEIAAPLAQATQTRPSGATATVRGEAATGISASFARVTASSTATVLASGLTTQTRWFPLTRRSTVILEEALGARAVSGAETP